MALSATSSPPLAVAAVDDFLASEDWRSMAKRFGWGIQRFDDVTLIVTLTSYPRNGTPDTYTLRVSCEYCPGQPPDVRFVNPDTLEYNPTTDQSHVAHLVSSACSTHLNYAYNPPYKYGPQLVCSSMTYGYYVSNHTPTADQVWNPARHSIGSAIEIVSRTLRSAEFYQGRFA